MVVVVVTALGFCSVRLKLGTQPSPNYPALPPRPSPPWTDRNSTVFYRTLTPLAMLPCFNSSTNKDVPGPREMHLHQCPRASNGQQNSLHYCKHSSFPKCVQQRRWYVWNFLAPGCLFYLLGPISAIFNTLATWLL